MGESQHHGNILDGLIEGWRRHRRVQRDRAFLRNSAAFDIERLAADVGMGVDELAEIIARGEGAPALSARMMAAHGLDRDDLAARSPSSLREISSMCSRCDYKHRCEVELNAGTAVAHAPAFCPNSQLLQVLAQDFETTGARTV
ncbi:DUF6455 family protein [Devosia sp. SL43]|uniref:DUF6455 family protein n=1 Tax=Devosia sp. SL43 TaxID=2806348 RepID=UPI001F271BE1|nr:DUF6455 family protein [Devosia sp. SL43]UJW84465.1 hypothetical protein IM737_13630 [Devosia sp. SL43]